MQVAENTVEGWGGVIADLAAKRQAAEENVGRLRAQKQELALEAAMGSGDAKKRLAAVNAELTRAAFEMDDLETALARAEGEKQTAGQVEAADAERQRKARIGESLKQYLAAVLEIDDALQLAATRFTAARQTLDTAESLMTAPECQPLQQLRSQWGPTLAAAHYGLGEFIELGRASAHTPHRQRLEAFTVPFVEPWLRGEGKEQ
jgi:chromosome segregation ATPase